MTASPAAELVPGLGMPRGRWSAAVSAAALARIEGICAAAGSIPISAVRAAGLLAGRLGVEVTGNHKGLAAV